MTRKLTREAQIAAALKLLRDGQQSRGEIERALYLAAWTDLTDKHAEHRKAARLHSAELSLAHRVGSAVENVYRRTDLVIKRRKLMEAWARYCCTPQTVTGEVMPLKKEVSA